MDFGPNSQFREIEWKYPDSAELGGYLDELFINYKLGGE